DVVEIGEKQAALGEVYAVKPLAVLAMIDDGELDWKIICIRADDPKADLVNDVEDVEKEFPGTLTAVRDWFRDYKIPDGKPPNKFGLDNKPADKATALRVIEETNEFWSKLVKRVTPKNGLSLSEGLGFEFQCVHFGHPSAGGCQRSTGDSRLILGKGYRLVVQGGYGRTDPLLNKPFYPNSLVVGILISGADGVMY
ncbi:unnamed protein product, partial [Closterium sp. NIES-54]